MSQLASNWQTIRQRIAAAAEAAQRRPEDIQIIAVSKKQSVQTIRAAFALGINNFAENYVQEALGKLAELADLPIIWHFIGHLQTNKAKEVAENFDWIHSIDSPKLVHKLQAYRPESFPPLQCCVQVNIDDEESKTGVVADACLALCAEIIKQPRLRLRGLMCIPRAGCPETTFAAFQRMATLLNTLSEALNYPLDTLSMGMSNDFDIAIKAGATHLRLGQALLGARHD